jgi:hypothetical protein
MAEPDIQKVVKRVTRKKANENDIEPELENKTVTKSNSRLLKWNEFDMDKLTIGEIKSGDVPGGIGGKYYKIPFEYNNGTTYKNCIFESTLLTAINGVRKRKNENGRISYSFFFILKRDNSEHMAFRKFLDDLWNKIIKLLIPIKHKINLPTLSRHTAETLFKKFVYVHMKSTGENDEDGSPIMVEDTDKDPCLWLNLKHFEDYKTGKIDKATFKIPNKPKPPLVVEWDYMDLKDISHYGVIKLKEVFSGVKCSIKMEELGGVITDMTDTQNRDTQQERINEIMEHNPESVDLLKRQIEMLTAKMVEMGNKKEESTKVVLPVKTPSPKKGNIDKTYDAPNIGDDFDDFIEGQ